MAGTWATIEVDLGKIVRADKVTELIVNGGAAVSIDALDQLEAEFETTFAGSNTARNKVFVSFQAWKEAFKKRIDALRRAFINGVVGTYVFEVLRADIGSTGKSTRDVLFDMTEEARDDSENVLENGLTVGAVTADADNVGDGVIVVYTGNPIDKRDEERLMPQDVLFQCTQDNRHNGVTAGAEKFEIQSSRGGVIGSVFVKHAEGATANRIDNGDFDTWTVADTPDSWTENTGAANSSEETSLVARSGGSALKITADGAATAYDATQAETAFIGYSTAKLKPLKVYCVSFYARRGAGADIDGTLTVQMSGTGYTPGSTEKSAMTTLTTSYALKSFFFVAPKDIPTDFAIQILWNGTPTSGRIAYIDDLVLQECTELTKAGSLMWVAAIRGATADFVAGPEQADAFTLNIANDFAGLYQTFLSRLTDPDTADAPVYADLGVAMPSVAAAPTFAEASAG